MTYFCNISTLITYADDTCLLASANSDEELAEVVNLDMLELSKWMCSNCLEININKTNFVYFSIGARQCHFTYEVKLHNLDHVFITSVIWVYARARTLLKQKRSDI